MRVTLNTKTEKSNKELKFPLIAIHITTSMDAVVLFVSETDGIALRHPCATLMNAISLWIPVTNTRIWRILGPEETVMLNND